MVVVPIDRFDVRGVFVVGNSGIAQAHVNDLVKETSKMETLRKSNIAFALIILAYCVYAGLFILRSSFVISGDRFFTLFDDAMISMRYAKNLAYGYGLVWNPGGEKVEGYTNLLWVLYMSVLHLLPIPQSKISVFIQVSGALFLTTNLFFVKKIADLISSNSAFVSLCAVFLTAFYFPLSNWSLQGMEVGVLTLIMGMSIWGTLRSIKLNEFSVWPYILLGVGTLVRIDMIVLFLTIVVFVAIVDEKNRSKTLVFGLLVLMVFVLLQTLFRLWYYGEILPNAYYLKMTGYPLLLRITRGLYVLLLFIWRMNWLLFLVPLSILLCQREKPMLLLFCAFLVQMAYSVYVGGDAWEWWGGSNRYLSIVMPIFFLLFSCGLWQISQQVESFLLQTHKRDWRRYLQCGLLALALISLLNFNAIRGPVALADWWLIFPPLHVNDNRESVNTALLLKEITNDQARIAVVWAGAIPYFSDRYSVDLLGKNDREIAHGNARVSSGLSRFIDFYPGHGKWDYSYSIGQLRPDIVVSLWGEEGGEEARPYLDRDYSKTVIQEVTLYLLNGSENILWDKMNTLH